MRRAFAFASLEQYLALVIGFGLVAGVSRLLSSEEVGLAAIGMGIATVAFSVREFVSPDFLIQQNEVGTADLRTASTLQVCASLAVTVALWLAATGIANAYSAPGLAAFLAVMCVSGLAEALISPTHALLRRDMAFPVLATINTLALAVGATATLALAATGHGFMSLAFGQVAGTLTKATLTVRQRPAALAVRPSLSAWRTALHFGGCKGAITVIDRAYEAMPQLLLGRFMPLASVGLYNRAVIVSAIPDRLLLSAVHALAFPALAAQIRNGSDLRAVYLRSLTLISGLYCPAMAILAVLAEPVVRIVLGSGWENVVPVVRVIAIAAMAWFPVILTAPVLMALGANRDALLASLVGRAGGFVILGTASFYGLMALAASQLVALPLQAAVAVLAVRRHVPFGAMDLLGVVGRAAVVTGLAAAGALLLPSLAGWPREMTVLQFVASAGLGLAGWVAALRITQHPLLGEIVAVAQGVAALRRTPARAPHVRRRTPWPGST